MLCFNLGCIGQYSWPAAGENHRRRRVQGGERRHTACLPVCLADAGSCYQPSQPYLCGELQPDSHFFHSHTASLPTQTQFYMNKMAILLLYRSSDIALNSIILLTNATSIATSKMPKIPWLGLDLLKSILVHYISNQSWWVRNGWHYIH